MKTTRTTVFLSLAILASFLFASSAAFAQYSENNMPAGNITVGGSVSFTISEGKSAEYGFSMDGSGTVIKAGGGKLILSEYNNYEGSTIVNAGTLTLTGDLSSDVIINNEGIFQCGTPAPSIASLTINDYGSFVVGTNPETPSGVYIESVTLTSGYIDFDVNDFIPGAEGDDLELDLLKTNSCTLTNGHIRLWFNSDDEDDWIDQAPQGGYLIIDAGESLTFNEDAVDVYADGQPSNNWKLVRGANNGIYLTPKSSDPDDPPTPPVDDPWYYANSQTDLSRENWEMNKNPKIGVKFPEGNLNTAVFGSADDPKTIVMTKNGDFTQGEYQIADGKTLTIYATISGDADLLKTGAGTLVLNGNNTYTGKTYVTEGTLTLATAGSTGTLKGGSEIIVDGTLHMNDASKGQAILSGQGDVFAWSSNSPARITLKNGGILQNDDDGDNYHTTVGAVIEMQNGVIQSKNGSTADYRGNYIFDNAIHVTEGTANVISVPSFAIRYLNGTTYTDTERAGYFIVDNGCKLTISSNIKNVSDNPVDLVDFVKLGGGELELTARSADFTQNFEIREGTVIASAGNGQSSTFGTGKVIIRSGATLICTNDNPFGYNDSIPEVVIEGTLIPNRYTHAQNITLNNGTIEKEYNNETIEGVNFRERTATVTSSGTSEIKAKMSNSAAGGAVTFNVTDGELTISGNNSMSAPMTKTGAGTLKLTNANGSTGAYTIQEGVVVAGNEIALGTGAVTITGDATTNAVGQLTIGASSTEPLDLTVGGLVTVDGGQINFDFTADNTFDTLNAANGFTFETGTFNLNFAQGTEATWYENAPEEGYKIVSITGGTYTGDEDLSSFLSGRTEPWTLTATADGIYLGQADDPGSLYWNPISDDGQNWPIDGTEKIGVKYNEESNPDDVKTASHDENITLETDGVFIIGDGYELDQVGPISGDGDLTKTEGGTLVLSGDNTYTGDTKVEGGTLELTKDNAIASSGNVTNNATIESTGNQTLNNLSGTNVEAELNANGGTLLLNNSADTQYKGTINGSAKVKKTGLGSLLFTGENTYEGGTEIEAGSLVLLTDEDSNGTAGVGPIEIGQNGELVYNVAAGQTKEITNEISGAGKVTKTGAGRLKGNSENASLQAGSFNVEQGRLDLMGEFEGNLNVGPLNDDGTEVGSEVADAVFSPGNSVGELTVYGDVNINAGATGLFEFSSYADPLTRAFDRLIISGDNSFTLADGAQIELSFLGRDPYDWATEGATYQLVSDQGFPEGDYSSLLSDYYQDFFFLKGLNGADQGDGLYLIGRGPENPGVPEPSTWALLLLSIAGLCWMRRRK